MLCVFQAACAGGCGGAGAAEFVPQQGVACAGEYAAVRGDEGGVVSGAVSVGLVQQQVGIVAAVGQVVDDHDAAAANGAGGFVR